MTIEKYKLSKYAEDFVKNLKEKYKLSEDEMIELINTAILVVNNEEKISAAIIKRRDEK
jgi:hypothetical protein